MCSDSMNDFFFVESANAISRIYCVGAMRYDAILATDCGWQIYSLQHPILFEIYRTKSKPNVGKAETM